jgi:hypothetical protein
MNFSFSLAPLYMWRSAGLVAVYETVVSGLLEAMREGEMRTQEQHARVRAAFTSTIARRMSACMPPNNLAALGPGGEQTPSQDRVIPS